jgi:hypothetical protein
MKRVQVFEFEDQRWLPRFLRDYVTELLHYQVTSCGMYLPIAGTLRRALINSGCDHIIDFGSGRGGAILQIQKLLEDDGFRVRLTMTDKYPNREAIEHLEQSGSKHVSYLTESVDATGGALDLSGLRTFFTCFHHFAPKDATQILKAAVEDSAPVAIFEFTERRLANVMGMLLAPIAVLAQTIKIRPLTAGRLFWTYILPVVPFIYWWDGTVSHWRSYRPEELSQMVSTLNGRTYAWEVGQVKMKNVTITYLIGQPEKAIR